MLEEVKDIAGMKKIANEILQTADTDSHTLEHHGIKGQRWGRRRTPAELGYRQAMRQKRKEEKLAARKEKYMRDPKQVYKHKNLFSQEEINRVLSRAQQEQRLYETSHAQQIQKAKERQAAKAERDAKRQAKAVERAQIKDEKRQERMHKLEEKTKLDIEKSRGKAQVEMQKQRDKAQAEREQANREYQTQQQIKKGKTLTARLAKLGALLKNVSTVAEQGQKLAADMGITAHYDSKKSLLSGIFGKMNWSQDDIDAFNKGMSGQEYKDWKARQSKAQSEDTPKPKTEPKNTDANASAKETEKQRKQYRIHKQNAEKQTATENTQKQNSKEERKKKLKEAFSKYERVQEEAAKARDEYQEAQNLVDHVYNARRAGKASEEDYARAIKLRDAAQDIANRKNNEVFYASMETEVPEKSRLKNAMNNAKKIFKNKKENVKVSQRYQEYIEAQREYREGKRDAETKRLMSEYNELKEQGKGVIDTYGDEYWSDSNSRKRLLSGS